MLKSKAGTPVFGVVNVAMAILFLVAAALQYNDLDPLRWAALYTAAFAACLIPSRIGFGWAVAAVVGGVALVWAVVLAPKTLPTLALKHLFESMKAETPAIERSRELLGLLLIAAWMGTLAIVRRRARRFPSSS